MFKLRGTFIVCLTHKPCNAFCVWFPQKSQERKHLRRKLVSSPLKGFRTSVLNTHHLCGSSWAEGSWDSAASRNIGPSASYLGKWKRGSFQEAGTCQGPLLSEWPTSNHSTPALLLVLESPPPLGTQVPAPFLSSGGHVFIPHLTLLPLNLLCA